MSEDKRYSIPWRKKLAETYEFKEQYILDMTKEEINALELGVAGGLAKATKDIKSEFFCVPIDIWNHHKSAFEAVLKVCMEEMKEANNVKTDEEGNDNNAENPEYDEGKVVEDNIHD